LSSCENVVVEYYYISLSITSLFMQLFTMHQIDIKNVYFST